MVKDLYASHLVFFPFQTGLYQVTKPHCLFVIPILYGSAYDLRLYQLYIFCSGRLLVIQFGTMWEGIMQKCDLSVFNFKETIILTHSRQVLGYCYGLWRAGVSLCCPEHISVTTGGASSSFAAILPMLSRCAFHS